MPAAATAAPAGPAADPPAISPKDRADRYAVVGSEAPKWMVCSQASNVLWPPIIDGTRLATTMKPS